MHMHWLPTALLGGLMPFGSSCVELGIVLSSVWTQRFYFVFSFLLLMACLMAVICAEVAIVLCYFQLRREDYRWWWRSFLSAGSTAFYVFAYSCVWFQLLDPSKLFITYLLYFGYMGLISFAIFCVCGTIGFLSCFWFTTKIFASIKVD